MPLVLNIILGLALAATATGAVLAWRRHLEAGRREDLQAMAARRGWSLTVTGERLGREGTLRVAPRGGHAWTVVARPRADEPAASAITFGAAEPRWPGGTLVARRAAGQAPEPGPALGRRLGPDLPPGAAGLHPVGGLDGLVLLADADPSRRVALGDIARVLAGWEPPVRGERGLPVVVLSPEGLRVKLRHPIARADHLERFVDLALDLARIIGP